MGQIGNAAVVTSAMASELFLKCLICLETGKAPRGHYLKELFDRLTPETRRWICMIWDAEVVPIRAELWDQIEGHQGRGKIVPRDLSTALSMANKTFEKVRYAYEDELEGVAYMLSDLPTILKRVILAMRPEWHGLSRPFKAIGQLAAASETPVIVRYGVV